MRNFFCFFPFLPGPAFSQQVTFSLSSPKVTLNFSGVLFCVPSRWWSFLWHFPLMINDDDCWKPFFGPGRSTGWPSLGWNVRGRILWPILQAHQRHYTDRHRGQTAGTKGMCGVGALQYLCESLRFDEDDRSLFVVAPSFCLWSIHTHWLMVDWLVVGWLVGYHQGNSNLIR